MSKPLPVSSYDKGCTRGGDYCPNCSHALSFSEGADVKGKTWRWEFNPHFGPTFLTKKGEPLTNQPDEKSPAWDVFDMWL